MEINDSYLQKEIDFLQSTIEEIATLSCVDYPQYTYNEVAAIIEKEKETVEKNYNAFLRDFRRNNVYNHDTEQRDYILMFSFPGAGKTRLSEHVHQNMLANNPKNIFNVLDKDDYRFLFPRLHNYLKNHIDENGRFEYPATNCIRTFLAETIESRSRSVLASGSLGAAVDFPENAIKAMQNGYHPHVIYLSVNKDIANLSNMYRSAKIFDGIIDEGKQDCPRFIPVEYYDTFEENKHEILRNLSTFQKQYGDRFELSVTNRNFDTLYNSRLTPDKDVDAVVRQEEQRDLTYEELKNLHFQVYVIKQNMRKRLEHGVYIPNTKEQRSLIAVLHNLQQYLRSCQKENITTKTNNEQQSTFHLPKNGIIFTPTYYAHNFLSKVK